MRTACLFAVLCSMGVAGAQEAKPVVADRPGGLLPCEVIPGQAFQMGRPDPVFAPRADGGVTGLFFYSHDGGRPIDLV